MSDAEQTYKYVSTFNILLIDGKFKEVNKLLFEIDIMSLSDSVVIGILSITRFATKEELPYRATFLEKAEAQLTKNLGKEEAERLLKTRR